MLTRNCHHVLGIRKAHIKPQVEDCIERTHSLRRMDSLPAFGVEKTVNELGVKVPWDDSAELLNVLQRRKRGFVAL